MQRLIFLLFVQILFAADYDCVFVGTSPIPLFEALYQHYSGKKVLILEQANECGGAWKSIDICGIEHADLGCHLIGSDRNLRDFLEMYGGCRMVSMDHPDHPAQTTSGNGYYFSKGCYELIHNLTEWMEAIGIDLFTHQPLQSVYVDTAASHVIVRTAEKQFTAKKVFYTHMSTFYIENSGKAPPTKRMSKYPHLYLLVQDPTTPKFSYTGYRNAGASRVMNLSHFVGLAGTGRHLIVLQVSSEEAFNRPQQFIDELKSRNLLDPSAYLLRSESYIYEVGHGMAGGVSNQFQPYFELLNTGSFAGMSSYLPKWKKILPHYNEVMIPRG